MIVSIHTAWVIFAEKVTFWDRNSHVAYQSHGFDPIMAHFGPWRAKYIGTGNSAPNYEIDRLFKTPIGTLFRPLYDPGR